MKIKLSHSVRSRYIRGIFPKEIIDSCNLEIKDLIDVTYLGSKIFLKYTMEKTPNSIPVSMLTPERPCINIRKKRMASNWIEYFNKLGTTTILLPCFVEGSSLIIDGTEAMQIFDKEAEPKKEKGFSLLRVIKKGFGV